MHSSSSNGLSFPQTLPEIPAEFDAPLPSGLSFEAMRYRIGFQAARDTIAAGRCALALAPLLDALASRPCAVWRPGRAACYAGFAGAAKLDEYLVAALGYGFAELLDRARLNRALQRLHGNAATVDAVAEEYRASRPHVGENDGPCRNDLDRALVRLLDIDLDGVVLALRGA